LVRPALSGTEEINPLTNEQLDPNVSGAATSIHIYEHLIQPNNGLQQPRPDGQNRDNKNEQLQMMFANSQSRGAVLP